MLRRLGYVAINLSLAGVGFRTCRLANATPDRLRELIDHNLTTLEQIIQFNIDHDILLYRITSGIIPFASHPVNTLAWWDEYADRLATIGNLIRKHDMRVSMHPGQFTLLNSPNPDIITNAVADLVWHCRFLDSLGVDRSCKVNIHVGGIYGDRATAMQRFIETGSRLPETILRRLTVENDDRSYPAEDVLEVATRVGIPVIFDWLHHHALPGSTTDVTSLMAACFDLDPC